MRAFKCSGLADNAAVAMVAGCLHRSLALDSTGNAASIAPSAAGGTRRQLRGVVGRTLLTAADRLP